MQRHRELFSTERGTELVVVRTSRLRWYASDDDGRRHVAFTRSGAIRRAVRRGA